MAEHKSSNPNLKDLIMAPTKYVNRPVPTISLRDFDSRVDEITQQLVDAAENHGFFCIVDHGISRESIDGIFDQSSRFFSQADNVKSRVPFSPQHNAGWEKNAQIRPSTGAVDRKESYQMQFGEGMNGEVVYPGCGFQNEALGFMHKVQAVSEKLMMCFARGLNFEDDYFIKAHDVRRPESQTVCRLLHYFETPKLSNPTGEVHHRAGAHADWDFMTLLFQKAGQSGLEICPGREVSTSFGYGDSWTKVEPDVEKNAIVCNVGDLLMSWSDDRFKSTFHRVKAPCEPDDFYGERYSIAFFNQPCKDAKIQGPLKKYPMVTGEEFTRNAMSRNYQAIQEKLKKEKEPISKVVGVNVASARLSATANRRENRTLPETSRLAPSTGRPPSPPRSSSSGALMASKTVPNKTAPKSSTHTPPPKKGPIQTTLTPADFAKKASASNGKKQKPAGAPNGNIMTFFKKAEEINSRIFLQERGPVPAIVLDEDEADVGWSDEKGDDRYNENGGSVKRRKVSEETVAPPPALAPAPEPACSPPPPTDGESKALDALAVAAPKEAPKLRKKSGPFVDDSDSEDDEAEAPATTPGMAIRRLSDESPITKPAEDPSPMESVEPSLAHPSPPPKPELTPQCEGEEYEDYEAWEDDDLLEGEEYDERRWMKEQQKLEMEEAGFEGHPEDFDAPPLFPEADSTKVKREEGENDTQDVPSCPICGSNLPGLSDQDVSVHVNACLDGNPLPLPTVKIEPESKTTAASNAKAFKRPEKPAKPGQTSPFQLAKPGSQPSSAFSKLMAGHAEDAAWASAAAENNKSRGKPAYQRTCPFYKIMPGFFIAVDAFRYGAVKGQNAYFLSHFHSDHYVGLTSSWKHGPIYCSRVTGNLVRQQLRVDPKWVVDLDFEVKTEVPETGGVSVTMISANHCPGSSLFLFEKDVGKGTNARSQRVLHCGDFRACQAHIEHPLLRPDVLDAACADMCVSLSKVRVDESDGWEKMKRERAGQGMANFVRKDANADASTGPKSPERGRLLVVVGTYSIGKERICTGIAKALKSKIYAPTNKQRICKALEDPELDALLTTDPRAAQVHMTPLFEIRAETLDEYLRGYGDHFSRVVGFRPSGWNYRPPKGRFTESPQVQTVLHSDNWRSTFSMKDLKPQAGSGGRASCFGVPYSEHSSFRELTMFCCALRIDKIIPTVNVGSASSREKMKVWCDRWTADKKKNGLFKLGENGEGWC
ncbi:DNA cross-link repair protein pso2/snm1 [Stemphylium lycopersici]|uniref:DNA cross-link repair protein pso2/snm1 n=1 Tax=Stemphylium lycopersici TaxID=183478 RepID=A0A364MUU9_STELY|nr:dna cross-link repair protein pso2 snm1 [Stemphylium lycopersici]RAR00049.1 DNA cross-link repair protein pso2/snm1 [Stemphylium lycopersici]RAR04322.1 DNA cross-link repair protein pso2/snm1 [Stemphylium lycopersici]